MLIRHLVTAIIATISLLFSYQATKQLARYIFDEVFDTATNFDKCKFDNSNFEPTGGFDPYEDILSAFDSAQSEPVETTFNAANLFGDSPSSSSDFVPPPSSSSDAPGASPSPSPDSPPPPPASEKSTTGHSGSTRGIKVVLSTLFITSMVMRSCWLKRRPLPPQLPPPDPPLPRLPPPPDPPPAPVPVPAHASPPLPPPPPQVSAPPSPSAAPSPAPAVMERLALVAAPARQVAGARRKSRRAKKRG